MGDAPKVVIFGAGITGLTAAHELVERGWDVTVVEKEIDPLNIDEVAIGGLAKTQWAVYQATHAPAETRTRDLANRRAEAQNMMRGLEDDLARAVEARRKFEEENARSDPNPRRLVRFAEEAAGRYGSAAANVNGIAERLSLYNKGSNIQVPVEAPSLVPTARIRIRGRTRPPEQDWMFPADGLCKDLTLALRSAGFSDRDPRVNAEALGRKLNALLDVGSSYYLARVGERLRALGSFVPVLRVTVPTSQTTPFEVDPDDWWLAFWLHLYLRACGADKVEITPSDSGLPPGVWQIETDLRDVTLNHGFPEKPEDFSGLLPGEHGFRFFPAFYRHLFDTLRRIPVRGEGQSFSDAYRTVYDNLIPTEANWLSLTNKEDRPLSKTAGERGVVRFPRRLRKSLRETFDAMNDLQVELGYTARDVELLKLRLFKYMTSCSRRRNEQYEAMSWSEFMGLSDLSKIAQQDMIRAPQLLAAMTADESDARTQGNVATQLLLDPINADERVDSTLNGPTSIAWFLPWRDYLVSQGVRFLPGRLKGFKKEGSADHASLRPRMDESPAFGPLSPKIANADYYVLALPVQAWCEEQYGKPLWRDWVDKAHAVREEFLGNDRPGDEPEPDHVERLGKWLETKVKPDAQGFGALYKGLSGIQLYFDADKFSRSGHTLFMDSGWRLSAISQASFWSRRRDTFDGYRGIVSVDIGALKEPYDDDGNVASFWTSFREDVHELVWKQISTGYGDLKFGNADLKPYRMYHLDEYIEYDPLWRTPRLNRAPFLINGVDEWDQRAGWDLTSYAGDTDEEDYEEGRKSEEPEMQLAEDASQARYQLMPVYPKVSEEQLTVPRWVLAGTFMQTWTRATTMEAANESARHAVNTLLHAASKRSNRLAELCRIWNPEMYEHRDLEIWRELDQRLYEWEDGEPLPHMFDILEIESLPDMFLEKGDLSELVRRLTSKVGAKRSNQ